MTDATHQGVGGQSAAQIMAQIRADAYARGRKDAFEEAAKKLDRWDQFKWRGIDIEDAMDIAAQIAAAIRALSDAQLLDRPGEGE